MTDTAATTLTVAGTTYTIGQAVDRFARYPRKTPARFDYPSRGEHGTVTSEEIRRTRYVSSRISHAEGDYFIARAADAPWIDAGADLAEANPDERGELFDAMSDLYWHFAGTAPKGVSFAKVSKVLHLKHPAAFPLLDSRLWKAYRAAARAISVRYPDLRQSQCRWIAVREDLIAARSTGAIQRLRGALAGYEHEDKATEQGVRAMTVLTDVRILDVLTW